MDILLDTNRNNVVLNGNFMAHLRSIGEHALALDHILGETASGDQLSSHISQRSGTNCGRVIFNNPCYEKLAGEQWQPHPR